MSYGVLLRHYFSVPREFSEARRSPVKLSKAQLKLIHHCGTAQPSAPFHMLTVKRSCCAFFQARLTHAKRKKLSRLPMRWVIATYPMVSQLDVSRVGVQNFRAFKKHLFLAEDSLRHCRLTCGTELTVNLETQKSLGLE